MNLPNTLTVSRLVLAFVMLALLSLSFPFSKTLALVVFVIAGITDYLDGHLARTVYGITSFGRLMDPLTDKVLICAAFVSFVGIQFKGLGSLVPAWVAVIIISREFLVTGLRLLAVSKGQVISAGKWGKHKTVWQIVAIVLILLGLAVREDILGGGTPAYDLAFVVISQAVAIAVSLITVASGLMYFIEHKDLLGRQI